MKIIKVSTELEMSVHEFPEGTMREQNKALYDLIGNGCDIVEHVMPKRLYTELKMPSRISLVQIKSLLIFAIDIPNSNRNPTSFLPFDGCIRSCVASSVK